MEAFKTMAVAAAGLKAQSGRMRLIAQNLANAKATGTTPGADPYRRQMPVFTQELDRAMGVKTINLDRTVLDKSDFSLKHDPSHPAADETGYVKMPNVNSLVETMDMREAMRSYEANLNVIKSTRQMIAKTLELLQR